MLDRGSRRGGRAREGGWAFERSVWGRGLATEAAARCIRWAFEDLGWQEVVHVIDPANTASIALAHKLGSTRWCRAQLPAPFNGAKVDLYGQRREGAVTVSQGAVDTGIR